MSFPGPIPAPADLQLEAARRVRISSDQQQAILDAAGGDAEKAQMMENLLRTENRGFGYPRDVPSGKGAKGPWQFTSQAWTQFGDGDFDTNVHDFAAGAHAASRMIDWIGRKYGTDPGVVAAYYNGGGRAANHVALGMDPPAQETRDYVRIIRGLYQPVPVSPPTRVAGTDQKTP